MAPNKRQRTSGKKKSLVVVGGGLGLVQANANANTRAPHPPPPTAPAPAHSRILAPFRAIGHITSTTAPATPFALLPLGKTFQITTALTDTLQTYDVRRLNLLFVSSPVTPGPIHRVVAHKDVVYAAFDDAFIRVWIFKRGKKVGELEPVRTKESGGKWDARWRELLVFGEWVIGAFDWGLVVWKRESGEIYTEIEVATIGAGGGVTAVVHPSTFLNKVVVGREDGVLEIWNVKTSKKIYTILSPLPAPATPTKAAPAITCLTQTPVISVLAIGYSTGEIHLHNIHTDTPLFTLGAPIPGAITASFRGRKRVTSLSFCTDPAVGAGKTKREGEGGGKILAVGDDDGDVTLWNLKKRKVVGVMRNVHEGPSGGGVIVEWLAGQNVLITSGGDNSVKEWIFDSPHTTLPRILRSRSGHSQPITSLTFFSPTNSHFLLSASLDRSFWALSLRNDAQSFEFSQGNVVKKVAKAAKHNPTTASLADTIAAAKAGPITCIATSAGEDGAGSAGREWEGIVTGHRGEHAARCWTFQQKKVGRWTLETKDGGEVKSVTISACGTFAFLGSSNGGIDMYNLQSGIHRRRFPEPVTQAMLRQLKGKASMAGRGKHVKAVTGLVSDALNRVLISTGLDGRIKFWEFTTGILLHEINWESSTAITRAKLHRHSDLLAVSCDDLCIRVVDIETRKVVRELWGAAGRISDFCFSNDGRWILGASTDSVIRIWDLPTGHLIDGVKTKTIVTAMAFSGTGEFLATAHVDSVGVNLWTNRTLFRHVPTRHLKEEDIIDITSPTVSGEGGTGFIQAAFDTDVEEEDSTGVYTTANQLSEKLMTMSLVPRARWQTLLNLDVIKQRNKPKEAPKVPEKAPFFLPTLTDKPTSLSLTGPSTNHKDDADALAALEAERSRVMRMSRNTGESTFTHLLRSSTINRDYTAFLNNLKTLPPSSADLEIRSLQPEELVPFVDALTQRLKSRRDYELVQTWINVFLKCHSDAVINDAAATGDGESSGLRMVLGKWAVEQKKEAGRLAELVGYCAGVGEFLRRD